MNNITAVYDESFFPNFKSNFKSLGNSTIVDSMQLPYYNILFFGRGEEWFKFPSKELMDDYKIWNRINSDFVKGKIRFSDFENFNFPMLKIWVDTTQIINNERMYTGQLKGDSYAVYIINNSNLWHIANTYTEFPILMQAMNRHGEWCHIEYRINSKICGGLFYFLEPKSYFVTSARKYGGDFKTKFRLKFKQKDKFIYSNEFSGSMNESQFEIPHLPKTNDVGKKNYTIFLE
ncbi:hypothetical protein [Moheibacter sediminis]|uniref:hypothetical protein n=1 Tax=Moheibacter sediminis TaxID=1434700 RepID=UPI0011800914|nr:hypothetical protein [Moheibacter sediminis]